MSTQISTPSSQASLVLGAGAKVHSKSFQDGSATSGVVAGRNTSAVYAPKHTTPFEVLTRTALSAPKCR